MRTHLVRIGNSKGIRIPKPLRDQCQLVDEVELTVEEGNLVIRPAVRPRSGWEKSFHTMAQRHEDEMLVPDELGTEWDERDWVW